MRVRPFQLTVRLWILIVSIVFSLFTYIFIVQFIAAETVQIIRLTQIYAFTSLFFLYITLLAGPFCYTFKKIPYRSMYIQSRRALGLSAFYFAILHASFAFFGQLGGFEGLFFLSNKYLLALSFAFIALLILILLAGTASDSMIEKLTFRRWKMIHRLIYVAGIFILIHALMLGTHFQDLSSSIAQIIFIAVAFLMVLEGLRVDAYLRKQFPATPTFKFASVIVLAVILVGMYYFFIPVTSKNGLTIGIHTQHVQMAKEAQNAAISNAKTTVNIPGLRGDRTKRYTVSFLKPESITPNTDVKLSFQIYNASNGNQEFLFEKTYEKFMHLIIVDNSLTYYEHIHPEADGNGFSITTRFPKNGKYHLYTDFQPLGAVEQQVAFTVVVGNDSGSEVTKVSDFSSTKQFGVYEVSLTHPKPLLASELSVGKQLLTFTIRDAKTKEPITSLKPYLSAFGHLVMIDQKTFEYIHVHPDNTKTLKENDTGGPNVEFMPLGLYNPIKPGIYRVFAQFNPDGQLFTANFTIKVE